ncbi:MAG: hypothetical protein WCP29_13645 [Acidobacteriota bacterium]
MLSVAEQLQRRFRVATEQCRADSWALLPLLFEKGLIHPVHHAAA